ncbi:MAG: YfcE family phosphodiesterase [Clostridia bacterium]|nr:YfcE family phosphodiesterase [Clostridia bacterium]
MKILIVSDLHGNLDACQLVWQLYQQENPDKVVLCGDVFEGWYGDNSSQMNAIFSLMSGKIYSVKGNNDSDEDCRFAPFTFVGNLVWQHFDRQLFLTHGHRYNKMILPPVLNKNDVLVYGHTHVGSLSRVKGLYVLNVGSLWLPRGKAPKSYGIIDDKGIYLKSVDGTLLESYLFEDWDHLD